MPAFYLEALTVTLGIVLLIAEAFVKTRTKSWLGLAGAGGLLVVLVLLTTAIGNQAEPHADWAKWKLWNFYAFDASAMFFKASPTSRP